MAVDYPRCEGQTVERYAEYVSGLRHRITECWARVYLLDKTCDVNDVSNIRRLCASTVLGSSLTSSSWVGLRTSHNRTFPPSTVETSITSSHLTKLWSRLGMSPKSRPDNKTRGSAAIGTSKGHQAVVQKGSEFWLDTTTLEGRWSLTQSATLVCDHQDMTIIEENWKIRYA